MRPNCLVAISLALIFGNSLVSPGISSSSTFCSSDFFSYSFNLKSRFLDLFLVYSESSYWVGGKLSFRGTTTYYWSGISSLMTGGGSYRSNSSWICYCWFSTTWFIGCCSLPPSALGSYSMLPSASGFTYKPWMTSGCYSIRLSASGGYCDGGL